MKLFKSLIFFLLFLGVTNLQAQPERWQQRAYYKMDIDFDVSKHQYAGNQVLTYINNSPDTLHKVFYHLYFNAFQPGSMMDVRSRTIADPDRRVGSRIAALGPDEIGFIKVKNLTQNGREVKHETQGTILEVHLNKPILPGEVSQFEMNWDAQVPIQIRRSGRDNAEGIAYSMAQWYPKMSEYDYQGWHSNPYIGREFYGIWGNFDVSITIDKDYIIGAGGVLTNPEEIGYGYSDEMGLSPMAKGDKITYNFFAENVHDFMWAADPDYTHTKLVANSGTEMHFFYQENERTKENWENLPNAMNEALSFINDNYGTYPYPVYAFIQGGDGGMEYPMGTLITGERTFPSLVGVSVHEWMHSWYQMVLGSNEALYSWMDEGFTSFASAEVMNQLRSLKIIPGEVNDNPHSRTVNGFTRWQARGLEEPLTTHSDHFNTNQAYGVAAYTKGAIFLSQLEEVIGDKAFRSGLKRYFETWKFKHPNSNDVIRVFEKESGLELDWYREYFVQSTATVDYAIDTIVEDREKMIVNLKKIGRMPMPLDVTVVKTDGSEVVYNIPLVMMRGDKKSNSSYDIIVKPDWPWVSPTYELEVDIPPSMIKSIHIDKRERMVDAVRENNLLILKE